MTHSITTSDIESLCGRPAAFEQFTTQLLASHPDYRHGESQSLGRWGTLSLDHETHTIWWRWPWAPDQGREPWALVETGELERLMRRWTSAELNPSATARLMVARTPRDPTEWAERLADRLRSLTHRPELRVLVHGPDELRRWTEGVEGSITVDYFRAAWTLAARPHDYSPCERALIAALDHGGDAREHWMVVADELQRRGDPTGESLALALASAPDRPSQSRTLSREYREREALRMANAPRHTRMLAFVDHRGASFAIDEFTPGEDGPPYPDGHTVRLWAERIGPFFVRLLARTDDPQCRGLGLPEAVFQAPELRYLSAARLSSIHPDCADVSGRDLSGFVLTPLVEIDRPVHAYEASLRNCDLRRADLANWQLDGADLRGAVGDLETGFGRASFDEARVSPQLRRLLDSWNAGRQYRQRGRARGIANTRRLVVE